MRKIGILLLISLVALTSVFAGGAQESSTAQPASTEPASKYGGVLRVAQATLDYSETIGLPFMTTGTETETVFTALYDKLWTRGADGKIKLMLAESYTVSDDGLEYTFTLKKGIKFHDGSDLTAEVVAWNYNQAIAHKMFSGVSKAEAIDESTVKVVLSKPNPFFLMANTAKCGWCITSKANYDKNGEDYARRNPVGTGPFKFVSMETGKKVVLAKNENYWAVDTDGSKLPYLDGLEVSAISDPTVAAAALDNNEIEVYSGTLNKLIENLEVYGIEKFNVEKGAVPTKAQGIRFMANNRNAKLLADERLRKAIAYAIDGQAIAAAIKDGTVQYTTQVALKGAADYVNDAVVYDYNPEKAKALLKEAGYPDGFEIEINIDQTAESKRFAELYQYYLGQVGIKVKIMAYATTERNAIQDRDDTWDQLLVSGTGIVGESTNVWANCGPERKKWRNMQPFDTEPEWEELWYKVADAKSEAEGYKALQDYFRYAYDHCCIYLFMHYFADCKYSTKNVNLQLDKSGIRWLDSSIAYFTAK